MTTTTDSKLAKVGPDCLPGEDQGEVEKQAQHLDQQQDAADNGHEAEQDSLGGEQDSLGSGQDSELTASRRKELTNFSKGGITFCISFHLFYF